MGMVFEARMITEEQAARLRADDGMVEQLLFEDDGGDDAPGRLVDLDKAWHGIHWLLTGSADETSTPTAWAIFGGSEIGEDFGYGPARLLDPGQVRQVAAALEPIDRATLAGRMDARAMTSASVYPGIWDEHEVFDEYLGPSYDMLRDFYRRAADEGSAVLQAIT
jgi:hypothetical protein